MNRLFIYYTHTGNMEMVASILKEKGFEIREVNSKLKLCKSFFFSVLQGGFTAMINAKPKLIGFDKNIDDYDEI